MKPFSFLIYPSKKSGAFRPGKEKKCRKKALRLVGTLLIYTSNSINIIPLLTPVEKRYFD